MKLIRLPFCLILFFCLSLFSCKNNKVEKKSKPYFDVESFIKSDIRALIKYKAYFFKTLDDNGQPQEWKNDNPDWYREFELFIEADINHEKCIGKYKADSIYRSDSTASDFLTIKYTTLDTTLEVRELKVLMNKNKEVTALEIFQIIDDASGRAQRRMRYFPFISFDIRVDKQSKFDGYTYYTVKEDILSKEDLLDFEN